MSDEKLYGKRLASSPRENMSKKQPVTKCEADPDTLVKIELESINDKPFFGQATGDELLYIWVQVFKRNKDELFGTTSTRSLTRNVRATYKLKEPTKLASIYPTSTFGYQKYLDDGAVETIKGKILGYDTQKSAEIGDMVKVSVKTNFGVEAIGVTNWLKLYGNVVKWEFVNDPSTGVKSDIIEVELLLRRHIDEFLPMYGQKVTVSYPGIPKICNRCYTAGHYRRDCNNLKREWIEHIIHLVEKEGIDADLIGSWSKAIQRWKNANRKNA
jgi:hypothetical protein